MKRLIIVSPHFPPTNAADHQRVRMALPHFREFGWEPEVIAVAAEDVLAPVDPFLAQTIPADVRIQRVRGLPPAWSRLPGFGSLAYRCRAAIGRALHARLASLPDARDALVYFSTTQFPVHTLIPGIVHHFGVRVVMDYQDPWVNDYYALHREVTPPGGRLKFAIANALARNQERRVVTQVAGFTAVSARYRELLVQRYPSVAEKPFLVLPFGAAGSDFEAIRRNEVRQTCFDPNDGQQHWVYVGRGGGDMAQALRAFFAAFRRARSRDRELESVRLHFIGTDYAARDRARPSIAPIADEAGVAEWIQESPARISYGEALRCLLDAHALVVPGSDDPGYTASKIYPYILARKPMLTIFRRESSVVEVVASTRCAQCVLFDGNTPPHGIADAVDRNWFANRAYSRVPQTDWAAFRAYSAATMTARLSNFLGRISTPGGPGSCNN